LIANKRSKPATPSARATYTAAMPPDASRAKTS
jgi:hypothetical protein